MDKNLNTYRSEKVVRHYADYDDLQKPEQTILNLLKSKLSNMKMLDIGVGGGRTTTYFAPLVKEYTGIDYSEKMIEVCNNKFTKHYSNTKFIKADVRDLNCFCENEFDFVLFSFNGIDCISFEERNIAFTQIKRVLKNDGLFCFSSHNTNAIADLLKIKIHLNIFYSIKRIFDILKIKRINKGLLEKKEIKDWIIINDGDHDFNTQYCYINPLYQIKILKETGYQNIMSFSFQDGKQMSMENEIMKNKSKWVYYLCS